MTDNGAGSLDENPHQPANSRAPKITPRDQKRGALDKVLPWHWAPRLVRQGVDFACQFRSPRARLALVAELRALSRGLPAAPSLLDAYVRNEFSPWYWVEHWARHRPTERAIADELSELTWRELQQQAQRLSDRIAQVKLSHGAAVILLSENSTFLVVALLAIQLAGQCPVLLNPATDGHLVRLALERTGATLALVERQENLCAVPTDAATQCIVGGSFKGSVNHVDGASRKKAPPGNERFALLFSSGTTNQPKLVTISNHRAVLSGYGMGVVCLGHGAGDAVYCVLPLSHATGLITGLCVALITGCGFVLRRRFHTANFWSDVTQQRITSVLYVGEVARRLVSLPPSEQALPHRVDTFYGNGMPLDVWHRLQGYFRIPRIIEFYGATELPLAMTNLAGAPGCMGRIAMRELSPWQIVSLHRKTGGPCPSGDAQCEPCADNEPGELVFMNRVRTGDIVARDAQGFVRYIDRRPGLFRQDGYNVSTQAVAQALRGIVGVEALGVTHLKLTRYEGQAGFLVAVPARGFDLRHLERAYERLPAHQRPRFLRLTDELRLNRGLKFDEAAYRLQGIDPGQVREPLYAYTKAGFAVLDSALWRELQLGTFHF